MSQARQYELVYIMSPDATEQDVTDLHAQIESIIARYQGELVKTENWGRRKLAFRIGKHREGTYVLEVFKGTGELTKELDRRLKVIDSVIRHLCVRVDEELRLAERTRARRDAETQRRIARGLPVGGRSRRSDDDGGDDEQTDRAEV
jgi:small subunit ribosomal protein S6